MDPKTRETALIHLYRGELGRMTAYRLRLDTTTNWAVGTTAAILTFALGEPSAGHTVFGLAISLNLIFLLMESRRYQSFQMSQARVRLLERGFFARTVADQDWTPQLAQSLEHPRPTIRLRDAVAVRLRRNYLPLIGVVYVGWALKLRLSAAPLNAAAIGSIPGYVVIAAAVTLFLGLGLLASGGRAREPG